MAGFAVLYQAETTPVQRGSSFQSLLQQTAHFKQLNELPEIIEERFCSAAKLDAPSSQHRGIARDAQSGSWLMATGTVVALEGDNDPIPLTDNLLRDYLAHGISALDRYDGHFGLVIYNGRDDSLSIISDPMGLFAIYYARRGQQVFISTSALALARLVESKADTLTIECFLRTGRCHGEKTLWQDVKRVRPATQIKIIFEKFEETQYWKPEIDKEITRLSMDDALKLADTKICRIFKRVFSRKGKIWADLTGGFDTRVTTMYLAKTGIPFTAYCVGPAGHPDVEISKIVSKEMGWDYRQLQLPDTWVQDQINWVKQAVQRGDGQLNVVQLASILKMSLERSHTHPVHVTGGGVDEWRYHVFGSKTFLYTTKTKVNYEDILNSRVIFSIPISAMQKDRSLDVRNELLKHLIRLETELIDKDVLSRTDIMFVRHRHPTNGGAYLSAESGTGNAILPFCFKELENFCFSMKHTWRLAYHYSFIRHLIEKGCPSLANIRTVAGGPAAPIRFSNIKKFLPLGENLIDHFSQKVKRKVSRKPISKNPVRIDFRSPQIAWQAGWLDWAVSEKLLEPRQMVSGSLYDPVGLRSLIEKSLTGTAHPGEFLEWVLTVEMALRATGASVG